MFRAVGRRDLGCGLEYLGDVSRLGRLKSQTGIGVGLCELKLYLGHVIIEMPIRHLGGVWMLSREVKQGHSLGLIGLQMVLKVLDSRSESSGGSQLAVTLPPSRGYLAMSGEIFGWYSWVGGRFVPRCCLNTLPCAGQLPPLPTKDSMAPNVMGMEVEKACPRVRV